VACLEALVAYSRYTNVEDSNLETIDGYIFRYAGVEGGPPQIPIHREGKWLGVKGYSIVDCRD